MGRIGVRGSFVFQAEDGIRDLVRSRGLGDVYKRQQLVMARPTAGTTGSQVAALYALWGEEKADVFFKACLLYTSDAADERSSVDLGGRRIIKKKTEPQPHRPSQHQ